MHRLFIILAFAGIGFALLIWLFPFANISGQERAEVFYKLILIFLLLSSAAASFSGNMKGALKQAMLWILVFLLLVTAYSFKPEAMMLKDRLIAQFVPYHPIEGKGGTLAFRKSEDGHFYIKAEVNGTPVLFLLDTGASSIVLTPQDAKRIGFDFKALRFNQVYNTANGRVMGASVKLHRLQIGSIAMDNIAASVNGAEMDKSLLGMRFLESLKSYKVEGDVLVLEAKEGQ